MSDPITRSLIRDFGGFMAPPREPEVLWTPLAEWLLHNGGLLNEWAQDWRPEKHGPLIPWLRRRVEDAYLPRPRGTEGP